VNVDLARTATGQPLSKPLRYLALAGPTVSGKTAAALAITEVHDIEIGTAKPTAAELAAVPHHLINIRSPCRPTARPATRRSTSPACCQRALSQ